MALSACRNDSRRGATHRRRLDRRTPAAYPVRCGEHAPAAAHPPACAGGATQREGRRPTTGADLSYFLDSSRRSRVVTIARFHYGPGTVDGFPRVEQGNLNRYEEKTRNREQSGGSA